MFRFGFCLFIMLMAGGAIADNVFKCTDGEGSVSFQTSPCTVEQGDSERIDADLHAPAGYVPENPYLSDYGSGNGGNTAGQQYKKEVDRIKKEHKKIWDDYEKEKCDRYKDYLEDEKDDWNFRKKQGYNQEQKRYHLNEIKKAQRDKDRECK